MPNKIFSIHTSAGSKSSAEKSEQLLLEVGRSYIAFILLQDKNRLIAGFELFTFDESEAKDFSLLLSSISRDSTLTGKTYTSIEVFINNELCLLVPSLKINQEMAGDYLSVVFGGDHLAKTLFDDLPAEYGMTNVYRVSENCYNAISTVFSQPSFRHSWSKVIRNLRANSSSSLTGFMNVLIYDKYITIVVMKDEKVQLIQSFIYEAQDDVLYYILNIAERFQLSRKLSLQLSGFFDLDFRLYRQLIKYYPDVSIQSVDTSRLKLDYKEHPLHYFTPFFNLAT
jgi:hypothetical protein